MPHPLVGAAQGGNVGQVGPHVAGGAQACRAKWQGVQQVGCRAQCGWRHATCMYGSGQGWLGSSRCLAHSTIEQRTRVFHSIDLESEEAQRNEDDDGVQVGAQERRLQACIGHRKCS